MKRLPTWEDKTRRWQEPCAVLFAPLCPGHRGGILSPCCLFSGIKLAPIINYGEDA